eukprot:10204586-Alexandrium_andersonii.AAC.1
MQAEEITVATHYDVLQHKRTRTSCGVLWPTTAHYGALRRTAAYYHLHRMPGPPEGGNPTGVQESQIKCE